MKRKAISVILILMTSVFLMFSVGCGGSSSSDGSNPAGVSGSAS
jgi:hypothetical protein